MDNERIVAYVRKIIGELKNCSCFIEREDLLNKPC